ncbi:MAG: RES family NAD+ phosphorylase [Bacteroidia bacterium]
MELYRITLAKWAGDLVASGRAARWNSTGVRVIYTASHRSLACLENIVHHNEVSLLAAFRIMVIYVPDQIFCDTLKIPELHEGWSASDPAAYDLCRPFGDRWAASLSSLLLRVPSALIKGENNVLINPLHPEFRFVSLLESEPFLFDPRIKS